MRASVLGAVATAAVLAAACRGPAPSGPPPPPAPPPPQVTGILQVDGLSDRVTVVRDRWGIPHITASNQDDLFVAQGFVQAQDRLFQMDLWRRSAQGRLAEVLGSNFIERDAMTRRMQYVGSLEAEWASYGTDVKAIATAFTRGINAWVAMTRDRLPEEFALAGWQPEPWKPEDLLTRTDAFVASAGADDELFRARLSAALGVPAAARLLSTGTVEAGPAPSPVDLDAINYFVADMLRRVGTPPFFFGLGGPIPGALRPETALAPAPLPLPVRPVAGTAFALGPARAATGRPLLAASWQGTLESPASRYFVHLTAPGWHVIGATAPWRPGVAVGHNDAVAWAFAPAKLDTQDVFVERLNPSNDRQVAAPGGRWRDMTGVMESVPVKGRTEPYEYEKQYTPHGVVIARDRERHLAYALRWSGAEPGGAAELGALAIGRARSWPEFRQALARWRMPVAEFVYADASGRVASQTAGLVPVRAAGRGSLPAAGWTRDAEWRGWLPLDRLPHAIDPRDALIAAAPGSRARAERAIERHTGRAATLDEVRATGRDVAAWNAGQLIPLLATLHAPDPVVEAARQRLLGWDRQVTAESADALLYVIWEHALLRRLAATRVPSVLLDDFVVRSEPILVPSVTAPSAPWFTGDAARQRDALLLDALAAAVDDERRWTGADASATWGRFQAVTFRHPLAITARAARRYNAGPFAVPGYSETMFATERVTAERSMGPVFQIALDVAAWDRSRATLAPGQSAAPDSPHFGDLLPGWLDGTGYPLLFSDAAVADATEAQLTLVPPAAGR